MTNSPIIVSQKKTYNAHSVCDSVSESELEHRAENRKTTNNICSNKFTKSDYKKPQYQRTDTAVHRKIFFALLNAKDGLLTAWRNEMAFRMEVICILPALCIMYWIDVGIALKITLCCGLLLLLVVELLNSAIEMVCDFVRDEYDIRIKLIKDVSSAAVAITVLLNLVLWGYALYVAFV